MIVAPLEQFMVALARLRQAINPKVASPGRKTNETFANHFNPGRKATLGMMLNTRSSVRRDAYLYGHEGQIKLIAAGKPRRDGFLRRTDTVLYQRLNHKAVATMHIMSSATNHFYQHRHRNHQVPATANSQQASLADAMKAPARDDDGGRAIDTPPPAANPCMSLANALWAMKTRQSTQLEGDSNKHERKHAGDD